MKSFDIEKYVDELIRSLQDEFGERLIYVGLQGSFRRGEADENSDIDIMVRYLPEGVSLLKHAHIMNTLSDLLGRQVDLVEEDCLLPFAAKSAMQERRLVYERTA